MEELRGWPLNAAPDMARFLSAHASPPQSRRVAQLRCESSCPQQKQNKTKQKIHTQKKHQDGPSPAWMLTLPFLGSLSGQRTTKLDMLPGRSGLYMLRHAAERRDYALRAGELHDGRGPLYVDLLGFSTHAFGQQASNQASTCASVRVCLRRYGSRHIEVLVSIEMLLIPILTIC